MGPPVLLGSSIAFSQCAGIPDGRTKLSSFSRRRCTLPITSFRSRSIDRSYPPSGKKVPCLSLRSRYVRAPPVLPATLAMPCERGARFVLRRISSCVALSLVSHHAYGALGKLPTFVTGVILLLSLWGAKRNGTSSDPAREISDIYKCAKLLDMAEARWTVAGRLRCVASPKMRVQSKDADADYLYGQRLAH